MTQRFTHSAAATFRACHRKFQLRYEYGLVEEEKSYPLRVGSAFARAVEADAKGENAEAAIAADMKDPFDLALVAAMFSTHRARWAGQELTHVAAELPFHLPLANPETGRATTSFTLDGKVDRIVRLADGRLALMEYKTTSRDFAPGADYWMRLHLDMQLSIYMLAARALGFDIATILYDVTRRPALRPLRATPIAERKYTKAKGDEAPRLYASQRDRDETPEEFAARCATSMTEDPDKHFARIEIARLDDDLRECAGEIWDEQIEIRAAQKSGRWTKNPDACFGQSFNCPYVAICPSRDLATRTPPGFVRLADPHPELTAIATDGG